MQQGLSKLLQQAKYVVKNIKYQVNKCNYGYSRAYVDEMS